MDWYAVDQDRKFPLEVRKALMWARDRLSTRTAPAHMVYEQEDRWVVRIDVTPTGAYLKIGKGLGQEYTRLLWLGNQLPEYVPPLLGLHMHPDHDWLLTGALRGEDLTHPGWRAQPERIVSFLAQALRRLHSLDVSSCSWGKVQPGAVVVHGNAVLSHFLADGNRFSGYLSLRDLRVDSPTVDLDAAMWSLERTIGPGWEATFLSAYKHAFDIKARF